MPARTAKHGQQIAQEVDLYHPSLRRPKVALSSRNSLRLLLLALSALVGWYAFGERRIGHMERELASLRQQGDTLQGRLASLRGTLSPEDRDAETALEKSTLLTAREEKLALLGRLRREASAQTQPLASYLEGLAKAIPPGVALESIAIAPGTQQIALDGQLNNPQLLPQLIQQLGEQPAFHGALFNHAGLLRDATGPSELLRFSLRSLAENTTEQGAP